MRVEVTLSLRGARYYKALELFQKGALTAGTSLRLEHESDNPHDEKAVAVRIKRTGAQLGHISRELAPKYAALVDSGNIIDATVSKISVKGVTVNLHIRVAYEQSDKILVEKHSSRLWQSASSFPSEPGVYSIRHIDSGRHYIGSSTNLSRRIHSHFKDLSQNCHANHVLQTDFSSFGADCFDAEVLVSGISPSNLLKEEAECIALAVNNGENLYNLTSDGQGTGKNGRGYLDSEPYSDRHAREILRTKNAALSDKRNKIIDQYASVLLDALPRSEFWPIFIFTAIPAGVAVASFFPKMTDTGVTILIAIVAFFATIFIKDYRTEKAKKSPLYTGLLAQRDAKIAALESGSNGATTAPSIHAKSTTVESKPHPAGISVEAHNKAVIEKIKNQNTIHTSSTTPETMKWSYFGDTKILRNNHTGTEYPAGSYEYISAQLKGLAGFQIMHGPDAWVREWDVEFHGDRESMSTASGETSNGATKQPAQEVISVNPNSGKAMALSGLERVQNAANTAGAMTAARNKAIAAGFDMRTHRPDIRAGVQSTSTAAPDKVTQSPPKNTAPAPSVKYVVGQKIQHQKFGRGVITAFKDNGLHVQIIFERDGSKWLELEIAKAKMVLA